jgi:hypothetical protein
MFLGYKALQLFCFYNLCYMQCYYYYYYYYYGVLMFILLLYVSVDFVNFTVQEYPESLRRRSTW